MLITRILSLSCLVALVPFPAMSTPKTPKTLAEARAAFQNPLPHYSSGPLWVWNDLMTDEQVTTTLHELADQHVMSAWVHPRPGLMTPYMSDEWLRLWGVALAEAEKLGMQLWIYDENSYPSGFAGGLVPDAMPDSVQKGFTLKKSALPENVRPDTMAVFALEGTTATDVTKQAKAGEKLTSGSYLTINIDTNTSSPWFGGKTYVDLLRPEVTQKFLELTMEPYRKKFGDKFGKSLLGVFTDEPNIRIHVVAYTERIYELFQERWGYDLPPQLASLFEPVGDWKRVRHNYFQLLNEQFANSWAKPYYEYCEKNHLELTGHYWDHEWPNVVGVPDDMTMYAWEQRPSIDCLMNQYREDTHGQFGNARMGREVSSVANQLGRERTLCEIYGAGGWDLRFEDQKRIADWNAVLGINTFNQHLTYTTLRGARKRDHPQSFSYHAPYWQDYHVMGDYLARLSAVASAGEQINDILLLQPTTTAFMYQHGQPEELKQLGETFQNLHIALERAQVEYDIGSEYVIEHWGSVEKNKLRVGKRDYSTVIIPPRTENLNRKVFDLLKEYTEQGGVVVCCGNPPAMVDGATEPQLSTGGSLVAKWIRKEPGDVTSYSAKSSAPLQSPGFQISWNPENNGKLFHQARSLSDGELLLMVNTSIDQYATGSWSGTGNAEQWNLESGQIVPLRNEPKNTFSLPPSGSLVIVTTRADSESPKTAAVTNSSTITSASTLQITRLEPNVLTLDYIDLQIGDELLTGTYFFKAAQKAFRKHGLNGNPWEKAVQFKDEILKTKIAKQLPVRASYRFTIRDRVPADLAIVIERPDLYSITCNGAPVTPSNEWWLDRVFKKIDLGSHARTGDNIVTIATDKFSIYSELEPAYLVGNFALEPVGSGYTVCADKPLSLGPWADQGFPMYGNSVTYAQNFTVADTATTYVVRLGKWYGSVARVLVNGKLAGHIGWAPWECDVTSALKPGDNKIEVVVVGTLKNTLGPFHHGKTRGSAWPAMFQAGPDTGPPPGKNYDVIDYGLFDPFQLIRR